jgi:hypothetical protein
MNGHEHINNKSVYVDLDYKLFQNKTIYGRKRNKESLFLHLAGFSSDARANEFKKYI